MRKMRILDQGIVLFTIFVLGICFIVYSAAPASAKSANIIWQWRQEETTNHPGFIMPTENETLFVVKNGYLSPQIIELDEAGDVIWETGMIQANSVYLLENDNLLITVSGFPGKPNVPAVIEMDRVGDIIWKYELADRAYTPRYAEKLANGNILITSPLKVLEVTTKGTVVWEYSEALANAAQAIRLENGNTLITDQGITLGGKVIEVTPQKEITWASNDFSTFKLVQPVSAKKNSAGEYTIVDTAAFRVITVDKEGAVHRVLNWKSTAEENWLGKEWHAYLEGEDTVIVSASYTNNKSTIMKIIPQDYTVMIDGELKDWNIKKIENDYFFSASEVFESSGMTMTWNEDEKSITAVNEDSSIKFTIGAQEVFLNKKAILLEKAPLLEDNKALIPLEFLKRILNWHIEIEKDSYLIKVTA